MIEERIREALDTEADRVVPHDHAVADNRRRLARTRRRRRLIIPLVSAVATAAAVTALVPLGGVLLPGDGAEQGPASSTGPSSGLDPRYRPTGPVVSDRKGMSFWFSGDRLCHRYRSGGGECNGWSLGAGAYGAVVGVYSATPRVWVAYGVAADGVTGIRLTDHDGGSFEGTVLSAPGLGRRIWAVPVAFPEVPPDMSAMTAHYLSGRKELAAARLGKPSSAARTGGLFAQRPAPLTSGVALFTFRPAGGGAAATMYAFVDGRSGGLGTTAAEGGSLGRGPYFGSVRSIADGSDARWWFGFLSPRMTKLVAELNDGRRIQAEIVDVHGEKVFMVRLPGVKPNARRNSTGRLVSYDASGKSLATWKI